MTLEREQKGERVPKIIGFRTDRHQKNLRRWRRINKQVPWSALIHNALESYFASEVQP